MVATITLLLLSPLCELVLEIATTLTNASQTVSAILGSWPFFDALVEDYIENMLSE